MAHKVGSHPPIPLTWREMAKLPVLFVKTLIEPFTNADAQTFYQKQFSAVRTEGVLGYTCRIGKAACSWARERPMEVVSLGGSLLLNHADLGKGTALVHAAVHALSTFNGARSISSSFGNKTGCLRTVLKVTTFVLCVTLIPTAEAYLPTYSEVRDRYDHGKTCSSDPWDSLINPIDKCLKSGDGLDKCRSLFTHKTRNEFYIYTRHHSSDSALDPVSTVDLRSPDQVCFYTTLSKTSTATRTCFQDLHNSSSRTVEITRISPKTHEGLKPGESMIHVGMELIQYAPPQTRACGFFHPRQAPYDVGKNATCLLISPVKGGEVSQLCFSSDILGGHTLRKFDGGIAVEHSTDAPASIVISQPQKAGINTGPDRPPTTQKYSFGDACRLWWNQHSLLSALSLWWNGAELPSNKDEL